MFFQILASCKSLPFIALWVAILLDSRLFHGSDECELKAGHAPAFSCRKMPHKGSFVRWGGLGSSHLMSFVGWRWTKYRSVELETAADKTLVRFEMKLVEICGTCGDVKHETRIELAHKQCWDAGTRRWTRSIAGAALQRLLWIGILHFGRLMTFDLENLEYIEILWIHISWMQLNAYPNIFDQTTPLSSILRAVVNWQICQESATLWPVHVLCPCLLHGLCVCLGTDIWGGSFSLFFAMEMWRHATLARHTKYLHMAEIQNWFWALTPRVCRKAALWCRLK